MTMTDHNFSSFGALLHTFRKRAHLTQQELARAIGVHRRTLIRWDQGDALPQSKAMVLELAHRLKLDNRETRQLLEASLTALAPHWSVPLPRNPFFTGREEILEALHTQLGIDQAVALTQSSALHGLGGVGKTQIALEYAYRYAFDYSAVFWIEAEQDEHVVASLLRIAETLQLPEQNEKDQQQVILAVQRWLSIHSQWLLIWDNVEDLTILRRFLPSMRSGALLLTTRRQASGTLARSLSLCPMGQEEGLLFLLRRAKLVSPEATGEQVRQLAIQAPLQYTAAWELVTVLGGLPLALDQAGAYLEETHCRVPAYLELFRTRRDVLLQRRGEGLHDHPAPVSTTFTLAIMAAAERHPAVKDLLQVCAFLQPDAIPEELFRQGGNHLGAQLQAVCRDPLEWDRVIGLACSYSLLSRQPEEQTLSIHRLVQVVLKDMLPETVQHTWKIRVLCAISQIFPSDEKRDADYWRQCERLLPHALLCLAWSEAEVQRGIALTTHVATYFSERSRYVEAEGLYLRAVCLGERTLGTEHPQVGEALSGLALLSTRQGKYAEAETLYLRAVCLGERTLGTEHPQVGEALSGLAILYRNWGKYEEAEAIYQRVLSIQERTLGADHPQVATVLQGLAVLSDNLGRYTEAEPLYQRVLGIRERTLGVDHPQVATVLHNLGESYREQGRYAEAEPLFLRALHIWEQGLGPEHPRVAHPLHSLAELHREQGRYAEAEPLFLRALHIWEQGLGPEHRLVATALTGLALLSQEQSRDAEAETLFQRALTIQEQHVGPQHPDTAQTLHGLAIFRQRQGNLGEACSLVERALAIRSRSLGDTHPQTIGTRTLHAQLVEVQTDAEEDQCSQERGAQDGNQFRKAEEGRRVSLSTQAVPFSDMGKASFEAFLAACCELHPYAWCRSSDLWQAYERWVEKRQDSYPLSRMGFTQQLKAAECQTDRTNRARIWRGITLVDQEIVTGSDG